MRNYMILCISAYGQDHTILLKEIFQMIELFDRIYKKSGNYFVIPVIQIYFEELKSKHKTLRTIIPSIDDNGKCTVKVKEYELAKRIWSSCGDLKEVY